VSTPSTSRRSSRSRARARNPGSSALVVVMSRLSSTRESAVFTDCPPGPGDRLKRHRSSRSGTTTESVTRRGPAMRPVWPAPVPIPARRVAGSPGATVGSEG
jgi:hypothetical protein